MKIAVINKEFILCETKLGFVLFKALFQNNTLAQGGLGNHYGDYRGGAGRLETL